MLQSAPKNERSKFRYAPLSRCRQPTDADDLFKLLGVVNHHGLMIVIENDLQGKGGGSTPEIRSERCFYTDLLEVTTELALQKLRVSLEEGKEKVVELVDGVTVALLQAM